MTRSSSSRNGTRCGSRPACGEATRPGQRASRSSSSARPTSARIRAKTSMVSATGGLTSGVVRTFDRLGRSATQALDIEAVTSPGPVLLLCQGWARAECVEEDACEVSFEAADRFAPALAFSLLALEIGTSSRVHARLGDCDAVEG